MSEKYLSSKANFSKFFNLSALSLSQNYGNGVRVTKIFKETKFEGVRIALEAKKCFQT